MINLIKKVFKSKVIKITAKYKIGQKRHWK